MDGHRHRWGRAGGYDSQGVGAAICPRHPGKGSRYLVIILNRLGGSGQPLTGDPRLQRRGPAVCQGQLLRTSLLKSAVTAPAKPQQHPHLPRGARASRPGILPRPVAECREPSQWSGMPARALVQAARVASAEEPMGAAARGVSQGPAGMGSTSRGELSLHPVRQPKFDTADAGVHRRQAAVPIIAGQPRRTGGRRSRPGRPDGAH